jgi:phosphocarrier protein
MKTVSLEICNHRGLHARAAAKFVELAVQFDSDVTVSKDGNKVSGNSILGLMMLGAALGNRIEVIVNGSDEVTAIRAIIDLVKNKFDEN